MSLRAMTKPAPIPPKPGCGGEAPATATERGRNRRSRPPPALAGEAFLRLAGARVVCPAIGLLSWWRTRSEGRWPSPKPHVRVNFGSILAAEGWWVNTVFGPAQRVDAPIGP